MHIIKHAQETVRILTAMISPVHAIRITAERAGDIDQVFAGHIKELVSTFEELQTHICGSPDGADDAQALSPSEAIFGFVGWLTTRPEVLEVGASKNADQLALLIQKFCEENNLKCPREHWEKSLLHPVEPKAKASQSSKMTKQQLEKAIADIPKQAYEAQQEAFFDGVRSCKKYNTYNHGWLWNRSKSKQQADKGVEEYLKVLGGGGHE